MIKKKHIKLKLFKINFYLLFILFLELVLLLPLLFTGTLQK